MKGDERLTTAKVQPFSPVILASFARKTAISKHQATKESRICPQCRPSFSLGRSSGSISTRDIVFVFVVDAATGAGLVAEFDRRGCWPGKG